MNAFIRMGKEQDLPHIYTLIKEFSFFQKTPEKVSISLEQMIKDKTISSVLLQKQRKKK